MRWRATATVRPTSSPALLPVRRPVFGTPGLETLETRLAERRLQLRIGACAQRVALVAGILVQLAHLRVMRRKGIGDRLRLGRSDAEIALQIGRAR